MLWEMGGENKALLGRFLCEYNNNNSNLVKTFY